jgi:hypothetical protein
MIKDKSVKVRYEHRLTEDIGTLKAGITLHSLSNPNKLGSYSAWNGVTFITISPEKVKVYQLTTTTVLEEVLVDHQGNTI